MLSPLPSDLIWCRRFKWGVLVMRSVRPHPPSGCRHRRARRRARLGRLRTQGRARCAARQRVDRPGAAGRGRGRSRAPRADGRPVNAPPPVAETTHADRLAPRLSRAGLRHAPFQLSQRRAARRGGRSRRSRARPSARRSIAIRPRRSTRHYQVFADAFADVPALVCYALKANSNQAVIKTLARARRRRRRGLGRRAQARPRGRHPAGQDHVLRHRQDRARACARGRRRHSLRQCRIRSRARAAVLDRGRQGPRRLRLGARQSRRRRQDPRQDRDRQGREQVRHPDQPRPRGLCPRGASSRA